MQLYVLDRAKNTLATTADFYNDTHIKTVSTGSSTFEFDIDKTDEAALYMNSGNYIVFNDDKGRSWSFSILSYEEHQTSKTIYCEDVGIELINKNMDIWETDQAYSFEYYFNLIAKDTPWKLGVNQLAGLSRKLTYTGRDTGLGRLLSVLTGFDKAECQFNIKVQQNQPVEFTVDVYKTIGTIQDNIQIVYGNELNDIKKTESRAEFVTAVQGVGGAITPPEGTEVDPNAPEVKVDFKDLEYKDENLETTKGDPFLRAVKANKLFNPGDQGYIESYYEYDTQSNTELLNRTITQLNTYSAPQYTYEADVQVIDPTLDIGDTVTIIDHDYNPALYLWARVATLEKSYTDPSKNTITFTNYELLNSSLAGKLRDLQSIINSMPSNSTIQIINSNLSLLAQAQKEAAEKLQVMMESADGKNSLYYNYRPANAKEGDTAFVKNPDSGNMEIWNYVGGQWTLTAGDATFDDLKTKIDKAQTDTQTAITTANTAVSTANQAVSAAGFANDTADQAKTAAASAQSEASSAFAKADSAVASALSAQSNASSAVTQASSAAANSKDAKQIAGAVSQSYKTLTDGSTMTIAELQNGLAVKLTKDDLSGYATETWAQNQIAVTADGINGTMSSIKGTVDGQTTSINDLKVDSSSFKNQFTTVNDTLGKQNTDIGSLQVSSKELTSGFNTLTTDNTTNKNDISQLKQTATEVSSTLETVKTQVQNSAVGTNLLLKTYEPFSMTGTNVVNQTKQMYVLSRGLEAGATVTLSFDAICTVSTNIIVQNSDNWMTLINVPVDNTNKHYMATVKLNGSLQVVRMRLDNVPTTDTITISNMKLELGSHATDYSTNPLDNATVTAVSKLSQTVDGMKIDISNKIEQTDLNGYATQSWSQGQISIAKNEITASVQNMTSDMATQTWTQGKLDLTADGLTSQISSVQDGLDTKYTSLEQTLKGVQVTANNAVTQSQYTQLAGQVTSTISAVQGGGINLLTNTGGLNANWVLGSGVTVNTSQTPAVLHYPMTTLTSSYKTITLQQLNDGLLQPSTTYTASFYAKGTGTMLFYCYGNVSNGASDTRTLIKLTSEYKLYTITFTTVSDISGNKIFTLRQDYSPLAIATDQNTVEAYIYGLKLEKGSLATDWSAAPEDVQSQITQTQSMIDQRVTVDGKIVAALSLSADGGGTVLITGKSVHITGQTTIDSGIITNAMISNATIEAAKIKDGAITNAKIANLDGGKITANSITADKLAVNAISVGLNKFGTGWQITPGSISFLPVGTDHATISLSGNMGITYGDFTTGEILGHTYGTPYNMNAGKDYFNGIATVMNYNGADYWSVLSEESDSTVRPRLTYSRSRIAELGVFQGWTFDDNTHFATIGAQSPDDNAQMHVVRTQIEGRWCTGFMANDWRSGIAFGDGGWLYLERNNKWIDFWNIVNKIGLE